MKWNEKENSMKSLIFLENNNIKNKRRMEATGVCTI